MNCSFPFDPFERAAFERHLPGCVPCRTELDALSDVRDGLGGWSAPDVAAGVGGQSPKATLRLVETAQTARRWPTFGEAPVWLQAAAAMLVVAASLGIANINLSYSRSGLSVTTGWMRSAPAPSTQAPPAPQAAAAPWRPEMTALEEKLLQAEDGKPCAIRGSAKDVDGRDIWREDALRALAQP